MNTRISDFDNKFEEVIASHNALQVLWVYLSKRIKRLSSQAVKATGIFSLK